MFGPGLGHFGLHRLVVGQMPDLKWEKGANLRINRTRDLHQIGGLHPAEKHRFAHPLAVYPEKTFARLLGKGEYFLQIDGIWNEGNE